MNIIHEHTFRLHDACADGVERISEAVHYGDNDIEKSNAMVVISGQRPRSGDYMILRCTPSGDYYRWNFEPEIDEREFSAFSMPDAHEESVDREMIFYAWIEYGECT